MNVPMTNEGSVLMAKSSTSLLTVLPAPVPINQRMTAGYLDHWICAKRVDHHVVVILIPACRIAIRMRSRMQKLLQHDPKQITFCSGSAWRML